MIPSLQDLRLLVVADDPLTRAGLTAILAAQPGCQVVGQATADADWPAEIDATRPDVIVWDLGWSPDGAMHRLADLHDTLPPVLALLSQQDSAVQAWRAGARGLLARDADPPAIVAAAQSLAQGLVALEQAFAGALLTAALAEPATETLVEALTPREHQVLQLLAEGHTNREIGRRLEISEHTVKFHVNAILGKLGAQSRTDAVMRATRLGMILL